MAPEAVLFDMDGVLVDSYEIWFHVVNATASKLGFPEISRDRFQEGWGQGIDADTRTFFPGTTVSQLEAEYDRLFPEFGEHLTVDPRASGVLAELARRGVPTVVVTNTPRELAWDLMRRAGLAPDALVGGTDVAAAKPAPDMVLKGCELAGVTPAQAVMVGDSHYDAEAAAAAGVHFIGFGRDGDARIERLEEVLELL